MSVPQSLNPEEDLGAALGETLKELRLAAGFTTLEAAGSRLGYSKDSISKAETGAHVPTLEMLLLMLDLYRVPEIMRKSILRQHALARKARGPIPQPIEKWFENEAGAAFLRLWALLIMPAQLQTRDYARAMFLAHGKDEDEAAEHTQIRIERQAILDGPEPPHVTAVIYERALYYLVGTPQIMIGELTHLLEKSRMRNVHVQVVREAACFVGTDGAFEIASGSGNDVSDTLLVLAVQDHASDDRALTRTVIAVFEEIRSYALNAEDSRALIAEAIEFWKNQQ
jgi:transcriptional regulator with XRE-family HTH domain